MPTILPLAQAQPDERKRMLRFGLLLGVLLALPVLALLVLEGVLAARCTTRIEAEGVLVGKTFWRIERKDCTGAKAPFHDVLIGVEGKSFASALTGRGEPHPLAVEVAPGGEAAIIRLSGPINGADRVSVALRRSGTPKERIDLERLTGGGARP